MTDCKQLISEHWAYIEDMLRAHRVKDEDIGVMQFHYETAFRHGWKHAKEDSGIEPVEKCCETCKYVAGVRCLKKRGQCSLVGDYEYWEAKA